MKLLGKTFEAYAHTRHARQTLGDRLDGMQYTDPMRGKVSKLYAILSDAETAFESLLEEEREHE